MRRCGGVGGWRRPSAVTIPCVWIRPLQHVGGNQREASHLEEKTIRPPVQRAPAPASLASIWNGYVGTRLSLQASRLLLTPRWFKTCAVNDCGKNKTSTE